LIPQNPVPGNERREEGSSANWPELALKFTAKLKRESDQGPVDRGALFENLGYALYRISMQSKERSGLLEKIHRSIESYENARASYRASTREAEAYMCQAVGNYLAHWIAGKMSERRQFLLDAWELTTRSLESFREKQNDIGYARTYNLLAITAGIASLLEWNLKARISLLEQAVEYGRETVKKLADGTHRDELAKAYTITSVFVAVLSSYVEPARKEKLLAESEDLWRAAARTSEKAALLERAIQSRFSMAQYESEVLGSDQALDTFQRIVACARETGDNIVISTALDMLAFNIFYKMTTIEDPDESEALEKQWKRLLQESAELYAPFSFGLPPQSLPALSAGSPDYHLHLAKFEIDGKEKRKRLRAALDEIPPLLAISKRSVIPDAIANAEHVASKILAANAALEEDRGQKQSLLNRAYLHRKRSAAVWEKIRGPTDLWNIGINDAYLADIEAERLHLFTSQRDKERILLNVIALKERSLKLCAADTFVLNWGSGGPSPFYGSLGKHQLECGDMYRRLNELRRDPENLRLASQKYLAAADSFQKVDQRIRMGGAYLKAAMALEEINDYVKASEAYILASDNYNLTARRIPSLAKIYGELSYWMKARSEIQRARNQHSQGEYNLAEESYRNAALLQESSGQWDYLAPGLHALALLEAAEDKSIKHQGEEVVLAFKEAACVFRESRISIETHALDNSRPEDKKETEALARTALARESYSLARSDFEEARVLQMKGEQRTAKERYARAIETLQGITKVFQKGPDRSDANFLIALSNAWQALARAEADTSPVLFRAASDLFEEAGKSCPNEKARVLLRGHSRYCSSLEAISRFLDKRRISDYDAAVARLDSASNYYITSGFHNASELSKGTRRLLEAHLYLGMANKEQDQGKRAQLYMAVERLLRASAESFDESGHVAKKNHITNMLDSVREEKDLALAIGNDLATSFVTTAGVFPTSVLPARDSGGVDKLQGAFVIASLFSSPARPRLGERVSMKIELANAGLNTAQLVRVESAVPEGFELVEEPEGHLMQKSNLIMRGRLLEPSKTEELSFVLKPKVEGPLALSPRVLYLDENGHGRIHEPDPLEIIVRDHGEVERVPSPHSGGTLANSPIANFLAYAFVQDYMRRRLSLDHAGWRGLPDIVRSLKIARSQVYGDARYGHTFGKPLGKLVKNGVVEFRVFPGKRGRGGNIVKVRVSYEKEPVRRFVDDLALTLPP